MATGRFCRDLLIFGAICAYWTKLGARQWGRGSCRCIDDLIWYAKERSKVKYRQLYKDMRGRQTLTPSLRHSLSNKRGVTHLLSGAIFAQYRFLHLVDTETGSNCCDNAL